MAAEDDYVRHAERLAVELGIPADYGRIRGIALQPEAKTLVVAAHEDPDGEEVRLRTRGLRGLETNGSSRTGRPASSCRRGRASGASLGKPKSFERSSQKESRSMRSPPVSGRTPVTASTTRALLSISELPMSRLWKRALPKPQPTLG